MQLCYLDESGTPDIPGTMRIRNLFPDFKDEGELIASWGAARLVKYLDGKLELKGGSKEDHGEAKEWLSMFWHEAVVREV